MPIRAITDGMWGSILELEAAAYAGIEPESLETLKSKWVASPELCFVYELEGQVVAYLLAHSWNSMEPPKLFEPLDNPCDGPVLFLHDLVVSRSTKGMGIGKLMVEHLFSVADPNRFDIALLVSVQNSQIFWEKNNFSLIDRGRLSPGYGQGAVLMQKGVR